MILCTIIMISSFSVYQFIVIIQHLLVASNIMSLEELLIIFNFLP